MKLIEALKQTKDLEKKAEDLREKIRDNSAYLSYETPPYENPTKTVAAWLQAHSDILKEILRLRIAIQRTNLAVEVPIELDGKTVTKTIAEWIHRRRDLAKEEKMAWARLTDRGLQEGQLQQSTGEVKDVTIVRNYSAEERDKKVAALDSEPTIIDGKLEIVNAVTDLME